MKKSPISCAVWALSSVLGLAVAGNGNAAPITIGTGTTQKITSTSALTPDYDAVVFDGGTLSFEIPATTETGIPFDSLKSITVDAGKSGTLSTSSSPQNTLLNAALIGDGTLTKTGGKHLILAGDATQFTGTIKVAQEWIGLDKQIDLSGASVEMGSYTKIFLCSAGTYKIGELYTESGFADQIRPRTEKQNITLEVGAAQTTTRTLNSIMMNLNTTSALLSFTKVGDQTLILSNNNTYTGATMVSGGKLQLGNGGGAGAISGDSKVTVAEGATIAWNRNIDLSPSNTFTGAGTIQQMSDKTLTLTNISGFTGKIDVNNATGTISLKNDKATSLAELSGTGKIQLTGTGAVTVGALNNMKGTLQMAGGLLVANEAVTLAGDLEVMTGTTSTIQTSKTTGNHFNLNGNLTGSGTLIHTGGNFAAHLFMNGDNSGFTGTVDNQSGWLGFIGTASGSEDATWKLGDVRFFLQQRKTDGEDATFKFGRLESTNRSAIVRPRNNTAFAGVTIEVGNLLAKDEVSEYAGIICDDSGKIMNVLKVGDGTWRLTGSLEYTGTTTVAEGVLKLDTTMQASDITVKNGAAITGTGTVGMNLFVEDGGAIQVNLDALLAGDNPLVVTGDLELSDDALIEFMASSEDLTVFMDHPMEFLVNDGMTVEKLVEHLDFSNAGGDVFWDIAPLAGGVFAVTFNNSAVPEPATWVMMVLAVGFLPWAYHRSASVAQKM
ncbi:MAG: autotransporter-associated beta strand repeat-containing protein [Planctomycetia bacterium]|nr:autotransporter-associated beta strand repeat-containing protein [Planctomycetia bacterium]